MPKYQKIDPELRALMEENARLKKIYGNQAGKSVDVDHTFPF